MKNKIEKIRSKHIQLKNNLDMINQYAFLHDDKKEFLLVQISRDSLILHDKIKCNYYDENKPHLFHEIQHNDLSHRKPLIVIDVKADYTIDLKSKYLSQYNLNIPFAHKYVIDKLISYNDEDVNAIMNKVKLKLYFGDLI